MPFTGYYEHTVDDKNRLSIPASLRNQMDPERDGKRWYVVPGRQSGSLWMYPEKEFNRLSDSFGSELNPDDDQLTWEQTIFPLAELLDTDSAGRVVLPARHLQLAGMTREVTVAGVRDHVEIVNRADFDRRKEEAWRNYTEIQRKAREAMLRNKRRQSGLGPEDSLPR